MAVEAPEFHQAQAYKVTNKRIDLTNALEFSAVVLENPVGCLSAAFIESRAQSPKFCHPNLLAVAVGVG